MNAFLHPAHRHTIFGALLASIAIAATLLPLSGAETKGKKASAKASAESTSKPKKSSEKSTESSTPKPKSSTPAEKKSSTPKASSKAKPTPKKSTKTAESPSPAKKKQEEGSAGESGTESTTSKPEIPGQPSPPLPKSEKSGDSAPSATGTETPSETPKPETPSTPAPASPEPDATASKEPDDASATTKKGKVTVSPNVSLAPEDLLGFELQPARVQQLIKNALDLARQKLTYTYGSADPANGGMDCSGAVHYLLTSQGFKDVPRDASGQYVWARKHGQFYAVVSKKADSFEFGDLLPGDLLFWNGTYNVQRDPPVTHTMIYLGVQRKRAQHVMWGSSDGRTYDGKPRWGVSVFDFKMPRVDRNTFEPAKADFLGYARIPGLRE